MSLACLETLLGLKGGCAEISTDADLFIDSKVTRSEIDRYIDQNQHQSTDDLFISVRKQAVREIVDSITAHMAGSFIARTIVDQQEVGEKTITPNPASAVLKGLKLDRCRTYPSLAYRVTRIAFFGQHTGNVSVNYYDGLTGNLLATDTIVAVSGTSVELDVNRLFRVNTLLIAYDATLVDGYTIDVCPQICANCPDRYRVNGQVNGRGFTSPILTPLIQTLGNDTGGIIANISMECDNEGWLCGIRQQMSMPLLWKTAELLMEYAQFNTSKENTDTVRDTDKLEQRHQLYRDQYNTAIERTLKTIVLPNDPACFHCRRTNRTAVMIP